MLPPPHNPRDESTSDPDKPAPDSPTLPSAQFLFRPSLLTDINVPDRVNSVKFRLPRPDHLAKSSATQSVVHEEDWDGFSQGFPEEDAREQSPDILRAQPIHNSPDIPPQRTPTMSDTDTAPSVFDNHHHLDFGNEDAEPEQDTEATPASPEEYDDGPSSYDLKAPPPSAPVSNIERLSERLFSIDHLKLILQDPVLATRFNAFLRKYRPGSAKSMDQYFEIQKALSAIDFANAIAQKVGAGPKAAVLDENFRVLSRETYEDLVSDALPGYITHRFVQVITETLVKEITGQNTPIMRELVPSLAEVYCLTDPALPDNPIVYASEEFYRTSQYGREYVIGRNCRFLQGPRTSGASVERLIDALAEGQEICETILNYRRDGSPFMNLLMIAPLYDNKGAVRYFIGAQIDINGLILEGRGLDSFEQLLATDQLNARYGANPPPKTPTAALAELASVLSDSEIKTIRENRVLKDDRAPAASKPVPAQRDRSKRMYFGMDGPDDAGLWPAPHLGPSGRLPGVFQNYILVRPHPSLRITFTSPALRIPGLLQSRLMEHIGGPPHIREGIYNALAGGISVTAKVTWLPYTGTQKYQQQNGTANRTSLEGSVTSSISTVMNQNSRPGNSQSSATAPSHVIPLRGLGAMSPRPSSSRGGGNDSTSAPPLPQADTSGPGKPRWIHCTPLMGSDSKVGVWMIVMVESETITGQINVQQQQEKKMAASSSSQARSPQFPLPPRSEEGVRDAKYGGSGSGGPGRLYAEYLRREGRENSAINVAGQPPLAQPTPQRQQQQQQQQQQPQPSELSTQQARSTTGATPSAAASTTGSRSQVQQGPWQPGSLKSGGGVIKVAQQMHQQMRGRQESRNESQKGNNGASTGRGGGGGGADGFAEF